MLTHCWEHMIFKNNEKDQKHKQIWFQQMRNLCPKCCKNHKFTRFGLTFSFLAKRLNFQRNVIWSDAEVRMSCRSQKWKTLQPQRLITKISFDTAKTEPSKMISHILYSTHETFYFLYYSASILWYTFNLWYIWYMLYDIWYNIYDI